MADYKISNGKREIRRESFNEQRYDAVMKNMDKDFSKSDKEVNAGKITREQYNSKQAEQEKKNMEYIKDMSQKEKGEYAGRRQQR